MIATASAPRLPTAPVTTLLQDFDAILNDVRRQPLAFGGTEWFQILASGLLAGIYALPYRTGGQGAQYLPLWGNYNVSLTAVLWFNYWVGFLCARDGIVALTQTGPRPLNRRNRRLLKGMLDRGSGWRRAGAMAVESLLAASASGVYALLEPNPWLKALVFMGNLPIQAQGSMVLRRALSQGLHLLGSGLGSAWHAATQICCGTTANTSHGVDAMAAVQKRQRRQTAARRERLRQALVANLSAHRDRLARGDTATLLTPRPHEQSRRFQVNVSRDMGRSEHHLLPFTRTVYRGLVPLRRLLQGPQPAPDLPSHRSRSAKVSSGVVQAIFAMANVFAGLGWFFTTAANVSHLVSGTPAPALNQKPPSPSHLGWVLGALLYGPTWALGIHFVTGVVRSLLNMGMRGATGEPALPGWLSRHAWLSSGYAALAVLSYWANGMTLKLNGQTLPASIKNPVWLADTLALTMMFNLYAMGPLGALGVQTAERVAGSDKSRDRIAVDRVAQVLQFLAKEGKASTVVQLLDEIAAADDNIPQVATPPSTTMSTHPDGQTGARAGHDPLAMFFGNASLRQVWWGGQRRGKAQPGAALGADEETPLTGQDIPANWTQAVRQLAAPAA